MSRCQSRDDKNRKCTRYADGHKLHTYRGSFWMSLTMPVVAGLLATGCLGNAFYVDERFTPEEETQIRAAAESWEAVGAEPLDFVWRQHVDITDTGRRVIVRASDRLARIASDHFEATGCVGVDQHQWDAERIILNVDRIAPGDLQGSIAHEIGHHYGIDHITDPDAVMFWKSWAVEPTPADRAALVLARQP